MPEPDRSPEPTLRHIIGRIDRSLRSRLNDQLAELDLTTPGYTMLFVLRRIPDLSNADLARRTGVTPQATNLTVLALLERGLVQRRPSKAHSKILQNRLTAKGQKLIERCEALASEIEGGMLDGFSADERQLFERMLRRSADNLGADV